MTRRHCASPNYARRRENVEFSLPPGVLRVPPKVRPQQYAARVNADNQLLRFVTPDITSLSVVVRITNEGAGHGMFSQAMIVGSGFPIISLLKMGSSFVGNGLAVISWLPYETRWPCCCRAIAFKWSWRSYVLPPRGDMRLGSTSCMKSIAWFDPSGQHFPRLPIEVL